MFLSPLLPVLINYLCFYFYTTWLTLSAFAFSVASSFGWHFSRFFDGCVFVVSYLVQNPGRFRNCLVFAWSAKEEKKALSAVASAPCVAQP